MLYLLLSIIAVGVLISIEPGQKLLNMILIILGIGFGLYVLYWTALLSFSFGLEFFETHPDFMGILIFLGVTGCIFYAIDKFNKKKGKKKSHELSTFNKNFITIALVSFVVFVLMLMCIGLYFQK